jgi:hypothetical protein
LDEIHAYGCTQLFSELSPVICSNLGLTPRYANMDSTDFHLDGVYNSEKPPADGSKLLHLTKGYSRDHRADLNQVVLNLITENQAGIPIHMEALDGNSSDKSCFRNTIERHIGQLQNVTGFDYLIMDSAGYTQSAIGLFTRLSISRFSFFPFCSFFFFEIGCLGEEISLLGFLVEKIGLPCPPFNLDISSFSFWTSCLNPSSWACWFSITFNNRVTASLGGVRH